MGCRKCLLCCKRCVVNKLADLLPRFAIDYKSKQQGINIIKCLYAFLRSKMSKELAIEVISQHLGARDFLSSTRFIHERSRAHTRFFSSRAYPRWKKAIPFKKKKWVRRGKEDEEKTRCVSCCNFCCCSPGAGAIFMKEKREDEMKL